MEYPQQFTARVATSADHKYAEEIADEIAGSSKRRATGIASRTPEFIMRKMNEGLAVIVIDTENGAWAGFCYLEVWQHKKYVANSGLIVAPGYRGMGISKQLKITLFNYSRTIFPEAKLFSVSMSRAVMHINKELGYKIVAFDEVMNDELFLTGCQSWVDYRKLMTEKQTHLPYVAMVFDPEPEFRNGQHSHSFRDSLHEVAAIKL